MLTKTDFRGTWQLTRQITDQFGQASGQLVGQAVFDDMAGTALRYRETGTFTLASGAQMKAERSYIWSFDDGHVAISFDDGRFFHRFTPIGEAIGTTHLCGTDTYNVAYDFRDWPQWDAQWRVTGPKKDYLSRSIYTQS